MLQTNKCNRYDSPSEVDQLNVISLTKMTLCTALFFKERTNHVPYFCKPPKVFNKFKMWKLYQSVFSISFVVLAGKWLKFLNCLCTVRFPVLVMTRIFCSGL